MVKIAIVYHSGYGHTEKVANAVADGVKSVADVNCKLVKAGELTATLLYPTPGEKGLDMAVQLLQGKKVPKRITLPTRVFTKENVEKVTHNAAVLT